MPSSPPARVTRRSAIATAAWSAPIVAVATPAPAFAASPCQPVAYPTGWTATSPASGSLAAGSGIYVNGYNTGYASNGAQTYFSAQDTTSTALASTTANDATVTVQRSLTLVVGRPYTFTFTVASNFGGDNSASSQNQLLDIQFNGVSTGRYTTQTTGDPIKVSRTSGYTRLSTANGSAVTQTVVLTYTPSTTAVTLRYLFTLPARGYNPNVLGTPQSTYSFSDDIAISAPTITGC